MNFFQRLQNFQTQLNSSFGISQGLQSRLLTSLIVIFVSWVIYALFSKIVTTRVKDTSKHYNLNKSIGYFVSILSLILIGRVWIPELHSLTTFLGLVSAGVAIAFKDILTDMGGWIFIIYKRPFKIGDRIQMDQHAGDVIDINVFQFTLLEIGGDRVRGEQSTGRMIHIPNNKIFTNSVANYTEGFGYIWHEIPVLITYESDRKKSKEILESIAKKHTEKMSQSAFEEISNAAKKYFIKATNHGAKVYTTIEDSGVQYTIRYLCTPFNRRETIELITNDILNEFDKHKDIDFAYPTTRIFKNDIEGKGLGSL